MSQRICLAVAFSFAATLGAIADEPPAAGDHLDVLRRENLVAWCIVPFDAQKRTPVERAKMLRQLGIRRCAYDWRQEHVPTFEQEILAYREHNIELFAFWGVHDKAIELFEKYDLHPQIWQTLGEPQAASEKDKVERAAQQLVPLARRTAAIGCQLGLYNHGGWGGQPENMVAVCERLRQLGHSHVGIVYNFHHGHEHIDNWADSLESMKPYLLCLNLNGMNANAQPKILGIGKGEHEFEMIREVVESGYDGPVGILDHRNQLDARESLQENLDGLQSIREKIGRDDKDDAAAVPFSEQRAASLAADAQQHGDALRGAKLFVSAELACLSCHQIGQHGGTVGPDLSAVGKQRDLRQIVESVLWPQRSIDPAFAVWQILTTAGEIHTGYKEVSAEGRITLRDPASGEQTQLAPDEVEVETAGNSLMPAELTAALSRQQKLDLLCFLGRLGRDIDPLSTPTWCRPAKNRRSSSKLPRRPAATHFCAPFPGTGWS